MNLSQRFLPIGAATMLALSSVAGAVPFTITNAEFLPGAGYGLDANETSGTLLDVRFATDAFIAQNFALNAVNQSVTFNFGTIDLEETSAHGGILDPDELDGLGISARLSFTAPTGVVQTVTATGVATPGNASDSHVDYVIDWSPVEILFGNGGKFQVSLTDMSFSDTGSQFQTATVTLLSLSEASAQGIDVPEPTSIALLGLGLAGVGFSRRKQ